MLGKIIDVLAGRNRKKDIDVYLDTDKIAGIITTDKPIRPVTPKSLDFIVPPSPSHLNRMKVDDLLRYGKYLQDVSSSGLTHGISAKSEEIASHARESTVRIIKELDNLLLSSDNPKNSCSKREWKYTREKAMNEIGEVDS